MDTLFSQIRGLAQSADDVARTKVVDGLRELASSLEKPHEAMYRIIYSQIELAIARVASDLNLYKLFAESDKPLTSQHLAETTGADPLLLTRILRYLASHGHLRVTDVDTYSANMVTQTLAKEGWTGGVYHYFDAFGPILAALPDFLKETKYKNPMSASKTAFHKAYKTDMPPFEWYPQQPVLFKHFNNLMAAQRYGVRTWQMVYPYDEKAQGLATEQALFVDIAGGIGHQCIALREALPDVPNRIIVQDQEAMLQQVIPHAGIEAMAQDLWQPQQIKGARMYYLRNILHDYPDDKAVKIFQNIKPAMGPDSIVLIDEMVIPDKGAHWQMTEPDIVMMGAFAALERTETQWYKLIESAGFKILKIYQYALQSGDSIIECVPS